MVKVAKVTSNSKTRGRPPGQGSTRMRENILDAAEDLFARQGFAATSLREVAEVVGANPAMVHYYFGSKEALLRQVLERISEPLAATLAEMKSAGHVRSENLVGLLLTALKRNPNMPLLMVREVMLPGGAMRDHFLAAIAPRLGGAFPGILAGEQEQGRLAADLDPNIISLLLLSLSIFPFIARNVAEQGLDISYDDEGLSKLGQHISRLLERGILS